jgi:D-galactarolactone isomerase
MTEESAKPRPKCKAPPHTCDAYIHIYGDKTRYKEAATNPYPTPDAPVAKYRQVMQRLGIERVVIVQPMAYGKDNSCTLDAIAELGEDRARGIAVVDVETSDAELARLTQGGIRGARFHMLQGGIVPWDSLAPVAQRVHELGWHIQLQMDGRALPERVQLLKSLPGQLVIDHTGKFIEPVATDHPGFKALLDLVATSRVWVKLSAPYETSKEGPPYYMDVGRLARGLIEAAPERMLWGTNWPHTSAQTNPPDNANMLDMLFHWAQDEAVAHRILVDNPAAFYGFSG